MSLEEMEDTWNLQKPPPVASRKPIQNAANSLTRTLWITWGALVLVTFSFALKVHEIWIDPARTFENSFWNLAIAAAGVACAGFGVAWARKFEREFKALGKDTVRCLDLLIYNVEWEIQSIRRDTPVMVALFLIMFIFAKSQSIAHGFEEAFEWNYVWMVLAIFGIAGVVLYHRLRAFLRPRLEELQTVRRQFDETA